MFLSLPSLVKDVGLTTAEMATFKSTVKAKFAFLYDDAHGVGYLLDPRFIGKSMDLQTRGEVESLICGWHGEDKAEEVGAELLGYFAFVQHVRATESRILKLVVDRKVTPLVFWTGLTDYPLLREVAVHAFSSACSSAFPERSFSSQKFLHSALRNRLRDERVQKLVHVFFNSKNTCDDHAAFLDEIEQLLEPSDTEQDPESDSEH